MPSSSSGMEPTPDKQSIETVAELVFRFPTAELRRDLEEFRIQYELKTGRPTDLTRRYTSILPKEQEDWLFANHPKLYWDGLPAFVQAFVKGRMQSQHRNGQLDDISDKFLELYLKGKLQVHNEEHSR